MTKAELNKTIFTMPSGTVASAVGSSKYLLIDRAVSSSILYLSEKATDAEIATCTELEDVLTFINDHKDYCPSWM